MAGVLVLFGYLRPANRLFERDYWVGDFGWGLSVLMDQERVMTRLLIVLLISGCSAEINEKMRADNSCIDTRDGESFSFLGETMTNPQWSTADACFDVTDNAGKKRTVCRSHETWLKCDPGFYKTGSDK